jgi:hypothetical protein
MTTEHAGEPRLEPTTTRTGGRSARVAALVIVVALAVVVYIGVSGRDSNSPPAPPVAVVPAVTATPAATASPVAVPSAETPIDGTPGPNQSLFPHEAYDLTLKAGNRSVSAEAQELQPGVFGALLTLPAPLHAKHVALDLSAVPQADPLLGRLVVSSFNIDVPDRASFAVAANALDVLVGPSRSASGVLGIESNGYRITATYAVIGNARAISVVLFVNPNAVVDAAESRRWVTGDDGLVGWPSALSQ